METIGLNTADICVSNFTKGNVNPLVPGVHYRHIHTWTKLQLKAAGWFKYVSPFSGDQARKC